tara:strand:+ start:2243 stop:2497 length:255 start_codon:yes stop_codon:yes gene_type:complete
MIKKEIQPIPDNVLSWLTVKGFINLYIEKAQQTSTLKNAYELAEIDYQTAYKRRRYTCYENFISAKWQYVNRILRKNKNQNQTK